MVGSRAADVFPRIYCTRSQWRPVLHLNGRQGWCEALEMEMGCAEWLDAQREQSGISLQELIRIDLFLVLTPPASLIAISWGGRIYLFSVQKKKNLEFLLEF